MMYTLCSSGCSLFATQRRFDCRSFPTWVSQATSVPIGSGQLGDPPSLPKAPSTLWSGNANSPARSRHKVCHQCARGEALTAVTATVTKPLADAPAAILLAWLACRSRSLLAARCFVEAVLQCYLTGSTFSQVQSSLKLAILSSKAASTTLNTSSEHSQGSTQPQQLGPEASDQQQQQQQQQLQFQQQMMDEQEESALLSWVALVMMAAALAGVPPLAGQAGGTPASATTSQAAGGRQTSSSSSRSADELLARLAGGPQTQDSQRYLQGLKGFAAQAQQLYRSGYSLDRLTALQATVSQGMPAGSVQEVMQQYTRVVVLTLEVLHAWGLAAGPGTGEGSTSGGTDSSTEEVEAPPPSSVPLTPSGFTDAFVEGPLACALPDATSQGLAAVSPARGHALRLLIAFIGGVLGSAYALQRFVDAAFAAYSQGWAAGELMNTLGPEDFLQTGGLIVTAVAPPGAGEPDVEVSASAAAQEEGEGQGVYAADTRRDSGSEPQDLGTSAGAPLQEDPWDAGAFPKAQARGLPQESMTGSWGAGAGGGPFGGAAGGGMMGAGPASSSQPATPLTLPPWHVSAINKQLFGQWLSTAYISFAQLGMPFPGAAALGAGWAWAGSAAGGASEAIGLDSFVQGALRRCVSEELAAGQAQAAAVEPQQQEQEQQQQGRHYEGQPAQRAPDLLTPGSSSSRSQISRGSGEGEPTQLVLDGAAFTLASSLVAGRPIDDPFTARLKQDPAVAQELQKARAAAAQEFVATGYLRGKPVPKVLVKLQDEGLASSSSALRLLTAQQSLVRSAWRLAQQLQQQQEGQQMSTEK